MMLDVRGHLLLLDDHVEVGALLDDLLLLLLCHRHLLDNLTDFGVLLNDVQLADRHLLFRKKHLLLLETSRRILMLHHLLMLL